MVQKIFKGSLKSLVVALGVFSLTTTSCTKSGDNFQSTETEIQSKRGGRGGGGGGSETNSIPQVTGLSATATGPTVVSLRWDAVPNATSYWIYRDGYVPAIVTTTSYADGYLSSHTTYTYEVAAVINSTLGPKCSPVTVTTP